MATGNTGASGLLISGSRESGQDVRISNVTAAISLANIIKSSLGPVGLDKMLVDEIGDVIITNDGATILKQLEVEHPAGRVLVDIAQLQDREVGDGTTSVVLLAAELMRRGNELVKNGIHPTTVLSGYRMALKAAISYIKKELIVNVNALEDMHVINAAKTSMSSKIIGTESEFFSKLAVDAVKCVKSQSALDARPKYPISAIHVLKVHGKSSLDSSLVDGFALRDTRASQGMPTNITSKELGRPVKIAMLDMNLQRHRMGLGVQITITDPKEIENIKQREMDITKERIMKILDTGANVIVSTKGIDDLCMKYLVEAGVIGVRRVDRELLKRLARATGGKVVTTMADMDGNEVLEEESLGTCDSVEEVRVGDGELMYFHGCSGAAATIVLRGPNEYMLDEMHRALHDSLSVVKRMLETNTLVAGGGAVETSLSVYLQKYATTNVDTREQLAIVEFADALLVIPKTLAVNAAKDSSELVAQLRSIHATSDPANKYYGLDLINGQVRDNLIAGVVEPAISKIKSLRFAVEAAITILRIDDRITVEDKQGGQGMPGR